MTELSKMSLEQLIKNREIYERLVASKDLPKAEKNAYINRIIKYTNEINRR